MITNVPMCFGLLNDIYDMHFKVEKMQLNHYELSISFDFNHIEANLHQSNFSECKQLMFIDQCAVVGPRWKSLQRL